MYPEDRVLVALVPEPRDFELIKSEGWYRIPQQTAPKGLYAEYLAFYFGRSFGSQKWAIHYFARNAGHELLLRRALFPEEPDHPRADQPYYRVQLGPLQLLPEPIISVRWRRVTFIHTTWDRFCAARELNDLYLEGGVFVDRLYATLRERGLHPEREYEIHEPGLGYVAPLTIPCRKGRVTLQPGQVPQSDSEVQSLADELTRAVALHGGALHLD